MLRSTSDYHTKDEIIEAPADGKRYEVVWGELLVTSKVSFAHQGAILDILVPLADFCKRYRLGEAFLGPADISWSPDTLVKPDVFVAPSAEIRASEDWSTVKTLRLVAEILSEETARADRFPKRRLYQEQGVDPLWLVDLEREYVEVWTPNDRFPRIETEQLTWHPQGAAEPLVIPVASLFAGR